jgi:hypothetical protein
MDLLVELGNVTDALLEAARCSNPDLVLVATLLDERQDLLSRLPESSATVDQRLSALRRIQAADSEIRSRFERRRAAVEDELRVFARRGPRRAFRTSRSHLIDRTA